MLEGKTTKDFSLIMHAVQVVAVVISITTAFLNLKGDVREIKMQVESQGDDIDRIVSFLGVWTPKKEMPK